jgi:hypothetical protein
MCSRRSQHCRRKRLLGAMTAFVAGGLWLSLWPMAASAQENSARIWKGPDAPMVAGSINGAPVDLVLSTTLPGFVALSAPAAHRAKATPPLRGNVNVRLFGVGEVRGRLLRYPFVLSGGQTIKPVMGRFGQLVSDRGDGIIGLAALPESRLVFEWRAQTANMRARTFPLMSSGAACTAAEVSGVSLLVCIDPKDRSSRMNLPAVMRLAAARSIEVAGDIQLEQLEFGLQAKMQAVRLTTTILGLDAHKVLARTDEDLVLPEDDEVVVVGDAKGSRLPHLVLGSDSMKACARMLIDRVTKTLTLVCEFTQPS